MLTSDSGPYLENTSLRSLSVVYKLSPNTPRHELGSGSALLPMCLRRLDMGEWLWLRWRRCSPLCERLRERRRLERERERECCLRELRWERDLDLEWEREWDLERDGRDRGGEWAGERLRYFPPEPRRGDTLLEPERDSRPLYSFSLSLIFSKDVFTVGLDS